MMAKMEQTVLLALMVLLVPMVALGLLGLAALLGLVVRSALWVLKERQENRGSLGQLVRSALRVLWDHPGSREQPPTKKPFGSAYAKTQGKTKKLDAGKALR
jgi:hypothetical protein